MDGQERKMLEESLSLSRENNDALKKILGYHRRALFWRILYWGIIVASLIAAYFSIQTFLQPIVKIYTGQDVNNILESIGSSTKK